MQKSNVKWWIKRNIWVKNKRLYYNSNSYENEYEWKHSK